MQDDAREVDFQSMHGQHERLTMNKKILEHCEDWQEGGGRGYRVTSSRLERFQLWPGITQWKKNDSGPLDWH